MFVYHTTLFSFCLLFILKQVSSGFDVKFYRIIGHFFSYIKGQQKVKFLSTPHQFNPVIEISNSAAQATCTSFKQGEIEFLSSQLATYIATKNTVFSIHPVGIKTQAKMYSKQNALLFSQKEQCCLKSDSNQAIPSK